MNFATFHQNLLGIDPNRTPPELRLTPTQERLYTAAQVTPAKHGYLLASSKPIESWECFLATFILAYAQTPTGMVAFAVSPVAQKWVNEQVRVIARHIFHPRATSTSSDIRQLYDGFGKIAVGSNVLQSGEPPRWVAYGFHEGDLLAPWMRGRLLPVDGK